MNWLWEKKWKSQSFFSWEKICREKEERKKQYFAVLFILSQILSQLLDHVSEFNDSKVFRPRIKNKKVVHYISYLNLILSRVGIGDVCIGHVTEEARVMR